MRIPFKIESLFNKVFKPQIVTIVETFLDDKPLKKFYGKSLTANFLQSVYAQFANNDVDFALSAAPFSSRTNGINTAGASQNINQLMQIPAATGAVNQGIVIGTGAVAPVPADNNLGALIANGVGAGQMQYQNQISTQGVTIAGANSSFVIQRLFINGSGGGITVNEIGIIMNSGSTFLLYRDVVSPGDLVPNGSTYRVAITFQITT